MSRPSVILACLALAFVAACGGSGAPGTVNTVELPGYGEVLATADDKPLYLLSSDPKDGTECTGECTKEFKPLIADGEPTAGDGVDEDRLGTFRRSDGGTQVLYNGHALYTYERADAGMGAGAGVKHGKGTWYLVDPDGEAITATAVGGY